MRLGGSDARAIDLKETPEGVAARLCGYPDFVFLDSSGYVEHQTGRVLSVIGCCPESVITCDVGDYNALQEVVALKNERGALIGWFDYQGDARFGWFRDLLVFDHGESQWYEVGETSAWWRGEIPLMKQFDLQAEETASMSGEDFVDAVCQAKSYIEQGVIYQVNLAIRYERPVSEGTSYGLYERLRLASPSPMGGFMRLGGTELLSSSPELFLKIEGEQVSTKPIKGTRPRGENPVQDAGYVEELLASEKEKAELLMITDLLRNDLGKVSKAGSVRVRELFQVESFEHIHHLVSDVEGALKVDAVEAVTSCLPGGSITGAPKYTARQVIEELESEPRGLYTGSLGYFSLDGTAQFNLLIRSVVVEDQTLSYAVGAGIVADSIPKAEYEETQQKARGVRLALEAYAKAGKIESVR